MVRPVIRVLGRFQTILTTTGSVVGTLVVNSALGFVYWWIAVRTFSPAASGLAVAAISAMALLGRFGVMGVATAVVGVLPTHTGSRSGLILAAFLVSGAASVLVGVAFSVIAPLLFPSLRPLGESVVAVALFTTGVLLTTVGAVLDTLLIGLVRGSLQLLRNVIFATVKLALILVAGDWFGDSAVGIYATWVAGDLISLLVVGALAGGVGRRGPMTPAPRAEWRRMVDLGRNAMGHHVITLARLAPALLAPILVAGVLSPEANARFYATLLVAGSLQVVAYAATFTLYAVAKQSVEQLHHQVRFTLGLSTLGVTVGVGLLWLTADLVVSVFGWSTSSDDRLLLMLIALFAYPLIVKDHWLALRQLQQDVRRAAAIGGAGALLEVVLAAVGAIVAGVVGLAGGWLVALVVQAVLMARFVYGEAEFRRPRALLGRGATG